MNQPHAALRRVGQGIWNALGFVVWHFRAEPGLAVVSVTVLAAVMSLVLMVSSAMDAWFLARGAIGLRTIL